ncbi:hypothetical protein ANCCEY_11873 [Ancylostoma ceylanicum]|uniref:Uncharacterized protein n=2 Tax=Ancylostoma ceylanicum TaxID=53326 RepID=A0A0D6LGI6_9BILA|nr:hypothetical protein ANCCEY_11873 [Ancylostoma ceylanicum]
MVQQCTCAQVEPCSHVDSNAVLQCIDQCQRHASQAGVSGDMVHQCFQQVRSQVDSLIQCYTDSVFTPGCAKGAPQMVPKRYMETFKLALFTEMNKVLAQSGIQEQVIPFVKAGKKFTSCGMNCVQRATSSCRKQHNCELLLPSDNVMVQKLRTCMQSSGFGTAGVQQVCNCLANAGANQFASVCNRLTII